jgi:DNA repair protein RadC
MHLGQIAFLAALLVALIAAFSRGGRTERLGGSIFLAAALLTPVAQMSIFRRVEVGVAVVDTLLLLALLLLAFRSERRWPTYAAAFQAVGVLTHLARFQAGPVQGNVYGDMLVLWSYPTVLTLLWGSLVETRTGNTAYAVGSDEETLHETQGKRPPSTRNEPSTREGSDLELLTRLFRLHGLGSEGDAAAFKLLARTGSFAAAVSTPASKLRSWDIDGRILKALAFARTTTKATLQRKLEDRPSLANYQEAIDYLHSELAHLPIEQFRVLYLNSRHRLICEVVHAEGTVTQAPVYPREVVKRAIEEGAMHLILAHNHPSSDPTPSRDDIVMTRAIAEAGRSMGITVIDHIVISSSGHTSMKSRGLI